MSRNRPDHLSSKYGTLLLDLLPKDGAAVPVASLAVALGVAPQVVGCVAGQMPRSVLRDRSNGVTVYHRHPSLCESNHGRR